mmetsp:Transcript_20936/g.49382  ORF Transcript_20936/g.49382 Transcript_20936/m.49382 type:complete len:83 (+) Transcript_20936:78-326(+)
MRHPDKIFETRNNPARAIHPSLPLVVCNAPTTMLSSEPTKLLPTNIARAVPYGSRRDSKLNRIQIKSNQINSIALRKVLVVQ